MAVGALVLSAEASGKTPPDAGVSPPSTSLAADGGAGRQKTGDPWQALRWLVGTWEGTSTGEPGAGNVRREYRLVLNDRFLEVRNTSTYPPRGSHLQGEVHQDFGIFSYDKARLRFVLRQFHVEGFVNTYVSEPRADPSSPLVFTSEAIENIPPGWRARETYWPGPDGGVVERFDLAEPGRNFELYSESTLRRVEPP